MFTNTRKCGLCAAASIVALSGAANADELLLIDLSVADQITVTATAGLSAVDASGSNFTGFLLGDFYAGAGGALGSTLVSGDLTSANNPSDGSPSLFRDGGGSDTGLNIWSFSSDSNVSFTAGAVAFVGSATWSLDSDDYADMVAGNATGDIHFAADDSGDIPGAMVLGTYRVVPSPAALSLLGLGLGMGATRRRR